MAAALAGGPQLLVQLLLAGQSLGILAPAWLAAQRLAGRRLASQLPFTVGIVDAAAEAEEALAGPIGLGPGGQQ